MKYMYIGKTVDDSLCLCVCFVGVQKWEDANLTAILESL